MEEVSDVRTLCANSAADRGRPYGVAREWEEASGELGHFLPRNLFFGTLFLYYFGLFRGNKR